MAFASERANYDSGEALFHQGDSAEPIHADDGAAAAGYQGALVAGVRTYGWVADAVRALVGRRWLAEGWADITLRRPLFSGETLQIDIDPTAADPETDQRGTAESTNVRRWAVRAGVGTDRVVLEGEVGVGEAPWLADIDPPPFGPAEDPPPLRPTYTLDTVPYGMALRPLGRSSPRRRPDAWPPRTWA
jgi:hypothetical protein